MIQYMNGSGFLFSKVRYMNGVGFEILALTPVPKLSPSYPPPPPREHVHFNIWKKKVASDEKESALSHFRLNKLPHAIY